LVHYQLYLNFEAFKENTRQTNQSPLFYKRNKIKIIKRLYGELILNILKLVKLRKFYLMVIFKSQIRYKFYWYYGL